MWDALSQVPIGFTPGVISRCPDLGRAFFIVLQRLSSTYTLYQGNALLFSTHLHDKVSGLDV